MTGTLDALGVLAQILGIVLGTMVVLTLSFVVFLDVWAKKTTSNKIYCFFLEQRRLFGKLLAEKGGKVFIGSGENKEEYLLDHQKQFWTHWPPGLPKFIQVPVRSHFYVRYNPEPYDPERLDAMISSKSLRIITDEAMLKQTWKDVRDSASIRGAVTGTASMWLLILVFVTLAITTFNVYMTMQLQTDIAGILELLGVK